MNMEAWMAVVAAADDNMYLFTYSTGLNLFISESMLKTPY